MNAWAIRASTVEPAMTVTINTHARVHSSIRVQTVKVRGTYKTSWVCCFSCEWWIFQMFWATALTTIPATEVNVMIKALGTVVIVILDGKEQIVTVSIRYNLHLAGRPTSGIWAFTSQAHVILCTGLKERKRTDGSFYVINYRFVYN